MSKHITELMSDFQRSKEEIEKLYHKKMFIVELRSGGSTQHIFNTLIKAENFIKENISNNPVINQCIEFKYDGRKYFNCFNPYNDNNINFILDNSLGYVFTYDKREYNYITALDFYYSNCVMVF